MITDKFKTFKIQLRNTVPILKRQYILGLPFYILQVILEVLKWKKKKINFLAKQSNSYSKPFICPASITNKQIHQNCQKIVDRTHRI